MTGTKRALLAFVLLAAMTSAGCQTPPTATRQESERAKFLTPSPGIALVYVIRVERDKRDRVFDVSVDGEPLGKTRQGNFLMTELTPGMHRITSSWKNLTRYNLDMEFKADKTYYLEQRKEPAEPVYSKPAEIIPRQGLSDLAHHLRSRFPDRRAG